jgi:hypothetical protein
MRGGCHLDRGSQARRGATPAHEVEPFGSIAARRALVPRRSESPADAKWPLLMEGAPGRSQPFAVTRGWGSGLGSSRPGGPT